MSEKLDLAELERFCAAATPGEWWLCEHADKTSRRILVRNGPSVLGWDACSEMDKEDAALIVALRNAAPALLSRLRALERVAAAAKKAEQVFAAYWADDVDCGKPLPNEEFIEVRKALKEAGL